MADLRQSMEKSEEDRRNFLKSCGRFAATVPPAMTVMLSTSLTSRAIAKSTGGGGGGGFVDDGNAHIDFGNGHIDSGAKLGEGMSDHSDPGNEHGDSGIKIAESGNPQVDSRKDAVDNGGGAMPPETKVKRIEIGAKHGG